MSKRAQLIEQWDELKARVRDLPDDSDEVDTLIKRINHIIRAIDKIDAKPKLKTYPATINGKTVRVTIPED